MLDPTPLRPRAYCPHASPPNITDHTDASGSSRSHAPLSLVVPRAEPRNRAVELGPRGEPHDAHPAALAERHGEVAKRLYDANNYRGYLADLALPRNM